MASSNKPAKEYHIRGSWFHKAMEKPFNDQVDALPYTGAQHTDGQPQVPDSSPTRPKENSSGGSSAWPKPPGSWPGDAKDEHSKGELNATPHTEPQYTNTEQQTPNPEVTDKGLETSVAARSVEKMTEEDATDERSEDKFNAIQQTEPHYANREQQTPRIEVLDEGPGTSVTARSVEQTKGNGLKPPILELPVTEPQDKESGKSKRNRILRKMTPWSGKEKFHAIFEDDGKRGKSPGAEEKRSKGGK